MQKEEDNAVTAAPDKAPSEADQYMAALNKRVTELQDTGLSRGVAFGIAELEARIARWPESWGDNLQVLIYGDFDAPDHDLDYPALGITVEAGKRSNTIIKTALCVVNARVKVRDVSGCVNMLGNRPCESVGCALGSRRCENAALQGE